jgi:hypothetical protein
MVANDWNASDVYTILAADRQHDLSSDITVLKLDPMLNVVIGYSSEGHVFFGCPQVGQINGFHKGRAKLEAMQTIDLGERGLIEPALALSFLVNSEEELRAISTIFSGLYDLNKNAYQTDKATLAAQGFEDYFADLPRMGLTSELEVGLFGELSIIENLENLKDRGKLGTLVEKYYFNHQPPNDHNPDFPEAGVELKVTGVLKHKSGKWVAKERLVLTMINYEHIMSKNHGIQTHFTISARRC